MNAPTKSITSFHTEAIRKFSGTSATGKRFAIPTTAKKPGEKTDEPDDWWNSLTRFPIGPAAHDALAESVADVSVEIARDAKHVRPALNEKRKRLNLLHIANAANHLDGLPEENESWHLIVKGNYPQWALVPAILKLADTPIRRLYLVTLGFSRANGNELLDLIDADQIENVTALVSCYFKAQDKAIYEPIHAGLTQRGQRMLAMRTHAKIILAQTDKHSLSIEGSANLRSCRNIEQFTIVNDRALFDFHAGWIDEVIANARPATNTDRNS
ncbi:MAG TPA: hypothetical protein PK402_13245 [Tepidisphaeraceae bacterium]|nr:hypothetical protein [Tepidisphaeraceae bacterium]